ncbi:MAG: thioredoxin family protein [Candidatus Obscuribacterales bacterium]|nr:thioredoxin family protein [Candidatus Obscuribacterales bacterium]
MKEAIVAFVIALVVGSFVNDWHAKEALKGEPPPPSAPYSTQNDPPTNAPPAPPVDPDFEQAKQARALNPAKPAEPINIPSLDDAGFDRDVIKSASPVLVYFKAQGSEQCARTDKAVQAVATQVQADMRVVAVDIMANPIIAEQYGAQEVPAFAVFKDGKKVDAAAGELDQRSLMAFIKKTVPTVI